MKNSIGVIVLVVLLASVGLANAESNKECMKSKGGMMEMHGMMMKMMEKSVVSTSDGGIVVVSGNKMSKYDKNLNLVKEVELKMPTMGDMQKSCPMMGKGMMDNDDDDAAKEPAEKSEHKNHH